MRRTRAPFSQQPGQLGQGLGDRDLLDRLGLEQVLELVDLAGDLVRAQPVAIDGASQARLVDAELGRQIDAGVDLRLRGAVRADAVGAGADHRHRRPRRRARSRGRGGGRLAREDLVEQLARRIVEAQELHAHAVRLLRRGRIERLDPGDLAVARQRDLAAGELDLERERRSDRQRRAAGDEHAAAGDVGRELVDEGVERREAKSDPDRLQWSSRRRSSIRLIYDRRTASQTGGARSPWWRRRPRPTVSPRTAAARPASRRCRQVRSSSPGTGSAPGTARPFRSGSGRAARTPPPRAGRRRS